MIEPGSPEKHVNPKSTRWMIRLAETTEGGAFTPGGRTRTWIWSDLHLHHQNIIRYCHRPFETVEAMDEALLTAWRETVGEADTIICGGDIALAGALQGERLTRVRAMPGRKLLVRGNHDFNRKGRPADTGCDKTWMSLVVTGRPAAPRDPHADDQGARRDRERARTRAQQRAVARGTVRERLRRAHRVPAASSRRGAAAGTGAPRRPSAAGGDDPRRKSGGSTCRES